MYTRRFMSHRALLLTISSLLLVACGQQDAADRAEQYLHLAAAQPLVQQESYTMPRRYAGLVLSRQSSEIGFERPGEVVNLSVDEGEHVSAGMAIARLDTTLLEAERSELQAQAAEIEARLTLNASRLRRTHALDERGFAAEQQLDELSAERAALSAQLDRVGAGLNGNERRLAQSVLRAPFAGNVSRRFVDQGAVVAAGTPVVRLIEAEALEARVGIPVRLHARLAPGDTVAVDVAGKVHSGQVITLGQDVTRATLTIPLRIALSEDTGAIAGDMAYLLLDESVPSPGYWLPATALTDGIRGLWNIYVLQPQAEHPGRFTIEARDVRVLYADETQVYVNGALADGEWAVAAGLHRLVPGQQVRMEDTLADNGDARP